MNSSIEPSVTQAALEHAVDDLVVHEGRAALVHDLGLALRIEVLRQHAHDAQQLALPAVQLGRVLLQEIEKVLLGHDQRLRARPCSPRLLGSSALACGSVRHSSL